MKKLLSWFLTIAALISMTSVIGIAANDEHESESGEVAAVCSFSSSFCSNELEGSKHFCVLPENYLFCLKERYTMFGANPEITIDGYNASGKQMVHFTYPVEMMDVFAVDGVDKCQSVLYLERAGLESFCYEDAVTEYTLTISAGALVKSDSDTNETIVFSSIYDSYDGIIGISTDIKGFGRNIAGMIGKISVNLSETFSDIDFGKQLMGALNKMMVIESGDTNVFEINKNIIRLKGSGSSEICYKLGKLTIYTESFSVVSAGEFIKSYVGSVLRLFFGAGIMAVAPFFLIFYLIFCY